jgi:hypothetical protein
MILHQQGKTEAATSDSMSGSKSSRSDFEHFNLPCRGLSRGNAIQQRLH